jgi:aryl-alcohol dehydrogenase-like predicted oxidoreductase
MYSKLAIGTANFGLKYGINNTKGKVSDKELLNILKLAEDSGIKTIDTAQGYGNAEQRLGKTIKKSKDNFQIITKLKPSFIGDVIASVEESITKLDVSSLRGVLFHSFQDFKSNPNYFTKLQILQEKKRVDRIGFSVYYPSEIEYLFINKIEFNLVQFPYSVFDTRFSYLLPELKTRNIEVHTRSTFLQGLTFMNENSLPDYLTGAKDSIKSLKMISKNTNISISALCLNFVINNKLIDKVIIGIDSSNHLYQNIMDINKSQMVNKIIHKLRDVSIDDEKIILPFNWNS